MQIDSFLLIGQSNMAGRGLADQVEPINNWYIKLMKNGIWRTAFVPYHWDDSTAGICLAESFADRYQKDHPDVQVGLIPCAEGGTCLDQWMPGQPLFESALLQGKLALQSSRLKGILWHQGEADCKNHRYPYYEEKCTRILTAFREELGKDLPVMVGGLGEYLGQCPLDEELKNYTHVNEALQAMVQKNPGFAFVSAQGLEPNEDILHINAQSLRTFGLRYYDAYKQLKD